VESSLNNPTTAKPSLRHRATEELKEFLILSLHLYVCLGAIIIMKSAILKDVGVEFDAWGVAAIKALLLAKFMLIGKAMRLGENKSQPLVWPTIYQSLLTLFLLIVLTTLEEILVGELHHRTVSESLTHVAGDRLDIVLATFLIMFLILVPYFAFRNLAEVLGRGVLTRLFFTDPGRRPLPPPP
jgi:cytochrome bd-type quinol oxidase subunit 2